MSTPKIVGELVIVAYKARHLPEREIIGKQDPFVVFRIGETIKKTKTDLRGGQHPTWDDQVNLPIPEKKKLVVVQVYDEDAKRQELISELELDITKVMEEGEEDGWYELQYKGRPAGEIYLELTFYVAKPPPRRQPTRYGMSKQPRPTGYVNRPPLPLQQQQQQRPYPVSSPYPPPPNNGRPVVAPTPVESHSTPTYHSPYPPHQQQQHQQQRPPYNITPHTAPYPPPVPTPSMSTGSQHIYPPQQQQQAIPINNSRPNSFVGQPGHNSRPTSPPHPGSYGSNNSASLLASSYSPANPQQQQQSGGPPRPNYTGYPPNNSGYPPNNGGYPPSSGNPNRNSYPGHNVSSPYPPQQQQFGGFPEPQQFSSGFIPHADPLGTPFAAHQGSFSTPHNNTGYPPTNNNNYPPQQGYPPTSGGYPPHQQHGGGYPPY